MIKPWLFLSRFRIYGAIAASLFILLALFAVTSFFNCDCPTDLNDLRILLAFPIVPAILGYVFGIPGFVAAPGTNIPNFTNSYPRFLLTRPVRRKTLLLAPMVVFLIATTLIPPLTTALLLAALKLFHPAGITHLLAIANLEPAVHALGQHPSLLAILLALDIPRRYLAGLSVGLLSYSLVASQRWLTLSPNRNLQILAIIPALSIIAPSTLSLVDRRITTAVLLIPNRDNALTYTPSNLGIALHLGIAAAIILGCWRIMRTAEL